MANLVTTPSIAGPLRVDRCLIFGLGGEKLGFALETACFSIDHVRSLSRQDGSTLSFEFQHSIIRTIKANFYTYVIVALPNASLALARRPPLRDTAFPFGRQAHVCYVVTTST